MSAIRPTPMQFENYLPPLPVDQSTGVGRGALRGAVAGMGTAALTMWASLPYPSDAGYAPIEVVCVLLIYGTFASVIGILPGLALGATLANLARLAVPSALLRLIGALGSLLCALVVSTSLRLAGVPGLLVAVLCGAGGALWVARGSRAEVR